MTFYDKSNETVSVARPPVSVGEVVATAQSTRSMAFRACALAKEVNSQIFGGAFPDSPVAPDRKLPALAQINEDLSVAQGELHSLTMWLEKLLGDVQTGPKLGTELVSARREGDRFG